MEVIKLWKIGGDNTLLSIHRNSVSLERHFEDWVEQDLSIIADHLLLIGRQITLDNCRIDVLAMDVAGDLVVIELKRDETAREAIAQALEYAAIVDGLGFEEIENIAAKNAKSGKTTDLEEMYYDFFGAELPEIINEEQRILIVASSIDQSTERIVSYLHERHNLDINAVTFNHFTDENGTNFLARTTLLPEESGESGSKKRSRQKNILSRLMSAGKIGIGTQIKFLPASAYEQSDSARLIMATVTTHGTKCLTRENDEARYSLSSLKAQIIDELSLQDIKSDYGFQIARQWGLLDGTSLEELDKSTDTTNNQAGLPLDKVG